MAQVLRTIKPSGGDFTSVHAALTNATLYGTYGNLAGDGNYLTLECYAMADTARIVKADFDNWTTSATSYIEIVAATGNQHDGTAGTGFRLRNTANTDVVSIGALTSKHVRFRGISFEAARAQGTYNAGLTLTGANGCDIDIERCLFLNVGGSTPTAGSTNGIMGQSLVNCQVRIRNCIVSGFYDGIDLRNNTLRTVTLFNNTVSDNVDQGIITAYCANVVATNNIATGNPVKDFYWYSNTTSSGATNLSSDTTAPGTSPQVSKTITYAGVGNYHLDAGETDAIDKGTDLSGDAWGFTDDIDGDTRSTWDIGADEVAGAAPLAAGTIALDSQTTTTNNLSESVAYTGGTAPVTFQWQRKLHSDVTWANCSGSGSTSTTYSDSSW